MLIEVKGIWVHQDFSNMFFQRETTLMTSCLLPGTRKPFQNRVYSKSKEFAPEGANSFLKE